MSLQLIEAARVLRFDAAAGWPEAFTTDQAIALQTWCEGIEAKAWRAKAADLRSLLALALNAGTVQVTTTARTENVQRSENREIMPGQRRLMHWTEHVQVKTRHITAAAFAAWLAANELEPSSHVAAWFKALGVQAQSSAIEPPAEPVETKEQRQDRRLQLCIDDGLKMPKTDIGRMPDGIGKVATTEGVTRQTFTEDVRAALARKIERERPKPRLVKQK